MKPKSSVPSYPFPSRLKVGEIVSRPNRFIMNVRYKGRSLRCHCPTTGRLGNLRLEGLKCLFSTSTDRRRKTAHTVEAISTTPGGRDWKGINQNAANRYVEFFIRSGAISDIARGETRREVHLGKSRIDLFADNAYIEVKTPLITLPGPPDAERKTRSSRFDSFDRLIRHMNELRKAVDSGHRAIIVLCYLYDAEPFKPPGPSRTNSRILSAAKLAEAAGVERWQVNLRVDAGGVSLIRYFRSAPYGNTPRN